METNEIPLQAEEGSQQEETISTQAEKQADGKNILTIVIVVVILILVGLIAGVFYLARAGTPTGTIRDIFIIFMALESLLVGLALIILIVQIARLINLLQNEIKPMLDSTQETLGHLRGTTVFLSNNLVEPVVKLNEYMAGFSQLLQIIGLSRKGKKVNTPKGE